CRFRWTFDRRCVTNRRDDGFGAQACDMTAAVSGDSFRIWQKDRQRVEEDIVEGRPFEAFISERGRFDGMLDFLPRTGLWAAATEMRPSGLKKDNGIPYGMPLSFFSPDGRISVAAAHSPVRGRKSNMPSKRPRSLMNASKGRPSTMSSSTRCRSFCQMRKLSPLTAAVMSQAWAPNPSSLLFVTHRRSNVQRNRQRTTKMFLSGLGLLQLLPPLLQGCGDPPPLFQV